MTRRIAHILVGFSLLSACVPSSRVQSPRQPAVFPYTDLPNTGGLAASETFLFVAEADGLYRWDLANPSSAPRRFGPSGPVLAVTIDSAANAVFAATERKIVRYHPKSGKASSLPAPPATVLPLQSVTLAVAGKTLWVGHDKGLSRVTSSWQPAPVDGPIRALYATPDVLLVGNDSGLHGLWNDGKAVQLGSKDGCDFTQVSALGPGPGGVLVLARGQNAEPRVALYANGRCQTYRSLPADEPPINFTELGGEQFVLSAKQLYRLIPAPKLSRRLPNERIRFEPLTGQAAAPFALVPIAGAPVGAVASISANGRLWIATRQQGVAGVGATGIEVWLRRNVLSAAVDQMAVACADVTRCYVATGGTHLYRFDKNGPADMAAPDYRVLSVVRHPDGRIYGLRQKQNQPDISVTRLGPNGWASKPEAVMRTPGKVSRVSFAAFAPDGVLWVGLSYLDAQREWQPYGVALVIDLALGLVAYHHASSDLSKVKQGVLPIPINVLNAGFCKADAWLATTQGAARVAATKVDLFSEAQGLKSEVLHDVACTSDGAAYIASGLGVARFDGQNWAYPDVLAGPVARLFAAHSGGLWLLSKDGLSFFDGTTRTAVALDGRAPGLLRSGAHDHLGRLWLLSESGMTIVDPR